MAADYDLILKHKGDIRYFIETGTSDCDTCLWGLDHFEYVITIEIDKTRWETCSCKYRVGLQCLWGDSGLILPKLVPQLKEPALFFLDGHWDGGTIPAAPSGICPIINELKAIFKSNIPHVILVDDAKLFGVKKGFPPAEEIVEIAQANGYKIDQVDDTFVLLPA